MTSKEWLGIFLEGRELLCPDGRPLFSYQMSKTEFEDLQKFLRGCILVSEDRTNYLPHTERLFVLYGAEWWHRNYGGGPWRWQLITDSLDWDGPSRKLITDWVRDGLAYWKRELHRYRSGNAYLNTIVLEGGIPLTLLKQQDARFTLYLKAIVGEHAKWSGAGMSAMSHASGCKRLLPKTFRREQIFQLAAEIVEVLNALSEGIESKTDPFSELNSKHPGWQKRLPMALEDEGAKVLIDALLTEVQKKRSSKYEKFLINRYLSELDGVFDQRASLEVPDVIPVEVIAEQLGLQPSDLPPRIELIARTDNNSNLKVASLMRVQREQDEYSVSSYRRDKLSFSLPFTSTISCTLQSAGTSIGDYMVEGSEAIDADLPMLFVSDASHGWRLLGGGSINTRVETGRLITPVDSTIESGDAVEIESNSSDLEFIAGKGIYDVSGELLVRLADDFSCRIRLGANRDSSTHYSLNGNRLYALEQKGLPVFKGMPSLVSPQGGVKPNKVLWRSEYQGAEWKDIATSEPLGSVRIRALHDKECLFAAKIVALPQDFGYAINRSDDLNEGTLTFHGLSGAEVGYTGNNSISIVIESEGDVSQVACQGTDVAGGRFPLNLAWSNNRYCVLNMPFPGRGARFSNVDHSTVCKRQISVNDLISVSAQAVSPQANSGYELVAELQADDIDKSISRSMYFQRIIPRVSEGFYELVLVDLYSSIKELFSYSADLDAVVRLEIISAGSQEAFVDVVQFDSELRYDVKTGIVSQKYYGDRDNTVAPLKFIPFDNSEELADLEVLCDPSDCRSDQQWGLKNVEINKAGLVLADGQLGRLVRPCVVYNVEEKDVSVQPDGVNTTNGQYYSVEESIESYEGSGVSLSDVWYLPESSARRREFYRIFQLLPKDQFSDDWLTLVEYVTRFKEAHPDCLDVHKALIDSPEAILGVLFRSQADVIDIIMEWEEYLPLCLWMIPIEVWLQALAGYRDYLGQFNEFVVKIETDKVIALLNQIKAREPNAILVVNQVLQELGSTVEETDYQKDYAKVDKVDNVKKYMKVVQQHVASSMFGRPDGERWPGGIDRETWNTLHKNPIWLDPGAGYRKAFLDAPVHAAFCVAKGIYLEREYRAFVAAIRNFDSQSFDNIFSKLLILFLNLRK